MYELNSWLQFMLIFMLMDALPCCAICCGVVLCFAVILCNNAKTNRLQITFIELYSISITEMQTTNGINSQLSITHSDRIDSGSYRCIAENPFGKSEHVIYVAVQGMYSYRTHHFVLSFFISLYSLSMRERIYA